MKLGTNQKKWIKALRSGEFKQGSGALQASDDRYCCLGVACVVAAKEGVPVNTTSEGELKGSDLEEQIDVQDWLKLRFGDGETRTKKYAWHEAKSLDLVNDGGWSFDQIANIIEQDPEEFFEAPA